MRPLVLGVFLASGFAALLYQVVWQRLLAIFSGADVYSTTIIVAAFMGGLGVGHAAGGLLADRVSRRTSLVLFGAVELAIALFGYFSATLYYDVLYLRLGRLPIEAPAMAGLLFVSLLWPTCMMGASLPLLARAITTRVERAGVTIGTLYGVNTLGAAIGALLATWWLVPAYGLEGSLHVGAALNLGCGILVLAVGPLLVPPGQIGREDAPDSGAADRPAIWMWAALYGLAGMMALSFEIVWFRLLGVMMKSTAFTFGTVLAFYLAGLGFGAVIGSRRVPRVRRPALAFLGLQAAAGLTGALLVAALVAVADDVGALRGYFGSYEPLSVAGSVAALRQGQLPSNFLRMYVGVPLLLVLPPTLLFGASFPFLQAVVQTDLGHVGRRVGALLVANIAGSMCGAILTGWLLLDALGSAGTLTLLVAATGVFVLLAARRSMHAPRAAVAVTVGIIGGAMAIMPDGETLWARLHGTAADQIVVGEDGSGVSAIATTPGAAGTRAIVFANGLGQSAIPYGDVHTALGVLPAFVHPDPRDAAVIGLGSGDTLYAVTGRSTLERITNVEIIAPQRDTLWRWADRYPDPALRALMQDPRVEYVSGDGRAYLMRTPRRFDIIEADALRPTSAYAGNLYSDAYFTLLRERLKPGGIAASWAPTQRVHNAFVSVFPYVVSLPGILLGSTSSIVLDRALIAARLGAGGVREHYARAGIDIEGLMAPYLAAPVYYGPEDDRSALTDINTDLFPRDEFDLSE